VLNSNNHINCSRCALSADETPAIRLRVPYDATSQI
jgi:hypothetical protein